VDRPNLMVKIPATPEGVPAIEQCLADGLNINITLIFSLERYEAVMEAYLAALERRVAARKKVAQIASVASFFVSRVDTLVDKRLDERAAREGRGHDDLVADLKGKAAIANAKLAYARFRARFGDERWARLAAHGARLQRPLWASTSTKNPAYPDVYYVEALVGPDTVDTMPPATLQAYKDHGQPEVRIEQGVAEAAQVIEQLEELGIRMDDVTHQLEIEGVKSFAKSFDSLLAVVEARRQAVLQRDRLQVNVPGGQLRKAVDAALAELGQADFVRRLWAKDATLWKPDDPQHQAEIKIRLGWLDVMDLMQTRVDELTAFAAGLRPAGLTHALLCGMGGSSLAPEVLRETFGVRDGYLDLAVLDSTDPAAVLAAEARAPVANTLFIIASKSGGTTEPNAMFKYFWEKVRAAKGEAAGENFIAITDPGTAMEQTALAHGFRHIFRNPPEIGGRYSALSYFGLVPAALLGVDVRELVARGRGMAQACGPIIAADENSAVRLGALMAALARAGRDKLTLIVSGKIAAFGYWVEQLIAESTGKEGLGILPVDGERLGAPEVYGRDRLFVHLRLAASGRQDAAVAALAEAGHPVVVLRLKDAYDLGGEFLRWEIATAAAGAVLGIDPFDQPNVQESKDNTVRLLKAQAASGALPDSGGQLHPAADDFAARLLRHLKLARRGDYVALTAYVHRTPRREKLLRDLQAAIRDRLRVATTVGYGPRFLHSTGQLHKGGANNGVFVQFTDASAAEVPVPGEAYSFGVLEAAQALGDYEALLTHGRRALRVDLGSEVETGLRRALAAVTEGVAAKRAIKTTARRAGAEKAAKKRAATAPSNGTRRPLSRNGRTKKR
jgi:transaldolase / glucose-6-phosphate isomerase